MGRNQKQTARRFNRISLLLEEEYSGVFIVENAHRCGRLLYTYRGML